MMIAIALSKDEAMLSTRANRYLAGLESPVPLSQVEAIFADLGASLSPGWLAFHERYAGYIEVIGADTAIWGLVHENPRWSSPLVPLDADVDSDTGVPVRYVVCADVHPSYSYELDSHGCFMGTLAESFDVHVERTALIREFCSEPVRRLLQLDFDGPEFCVGTLKHSEVHEATDRYFSYMMTERTLIVFTKETRRCHGWVRLS